MTEKATGSGVRCRLVAYPGPEPTISLGFELENSGPDTWRGDVLEPVLPWDLRAWVAGVEVRVDQPALDLPGRRRSLELEPGESVELPSPIVLAFGDSPSPGSSPFVWTLLSPPAEVELQASVTAGNERFLSDKTTVATTPL